MSRTLETAVVFSISLVILFAYALGAAVPYAILLERAECESQDFFRSPAGSSVYRRYLGERGTEQLEIHVDRALDFISLIQDSGEIWSPAGGE